MSEVPHFRRGLWPRKRVKIRTTAKGKPQELYFLFFILKIISALIIYFYLPTLYIFIFKECCFSYIYKTNQAAFSQLIWGHFSPPSSVRRKHHDFPSPHLFPPSSFSTLIWNIWGEKDHKNADFEGCGRFSVFFVVFLLLLFPLWVLKQLNLCVCLLQSSDKHFSLYNHYLRRTINYTTFWLS